ncbi:MAG TPA: outer membrane beta-barrel protein [Candidatus Cybelea sp.]|nr:outer membrane beta-barrel protein [Candidatus Cybelea sp.]
MKPMLWIAPAILVLSVTAHGQVTPQWEISGDYSYARANLNGSSFTLNGGGGALAQNLNDWFGARFEANAFGTTTAGTRVTMQTVTFGPVFTYRKLSRVTLYGDVEFGDVHASAGYLGISTSANKFAMNAGGGVDFALNERAAIRVQGNYLMTRFLNARQDNLQVSTALVIRIGQQY